MAQLTARPDRPEPTRSRPHMPAGYGVPKDSAGMFAWADLREPLETAKTFWVATMRPDGRPHAVPLWGAWIDDAFYFEVSPETRRGRNLAQNPAVVVHLERDNLAIMIEGDAEVITPDAALDAKLGDTFEAKYRYRPDSGQPWHIVRPHKVLAWEAFPTTPTRFSFGPA